MLVQESLDWSPVYPLNYWSNLTNKYKFSALVFHFFFLFVLMLVTSNCCTFDYWKILIFPTVFWELRVNAFLRRTPKVTVKPSKLLNIKFVFASCNIMPHIINITWMESISKKLSNNLLKPFIINWLVWKLRHILKGLICWFELHDKKISEFFTVLWLPIIGSKKSNKIVLQQITFLMII